MGNIVHGYKVFTPDWTCRDFQYEVGKTYKHNGKIGICKAGFHFCQELESCFNYYPFSCRNKIAEVEAIGDVETDGNKSVTNIIRIAREISWYEMLEMCNTGEGNSGRGNCGSYNTGHANCGNYNTGRANYGNRNSGDANNGSKNSGYCNLGYNNTGDYNIGDRNSGSNNIGHCNVGYGNIGNSNNGCFNKGNNLQGYFNTKQPQTMVFNMPTDCSLMDYTIMSKILSRMRTTEFVKSNRLTDEEKEIHKEYTTMGGYLRKLTPEESWERVWDGLSKNEKRAVAKLPNFDPDIFKEITGIDVTKQ